MTFILRPAVRENVGLIIGIAGASGAGKTFSAMRLAAGMTPTGKKFAVIDTEAGRAKHYADQFAFDHGDLKAPFRPDAYADAIAAAEGAGYPVILVDSCSHEHAGEGGLLDWQEDELRRMAGDDWKKREACKMAAWVKPKMAHKHMVQRLLQVRAHLILCFRAEQKIEMVRGQDGKMEIVPKKIASGFSDWIPICEKNILYELTASFLLTPEKPGVPLPIKLQEQHRAHFALDKPIDEKAGKALAEWARGGSAKPQPKADVAPVAETTPTTTEGASLFNDARATVSEIFAVKASLPKVVPPKVWRALCKDLCGVDPQDDVEREIVEADLNPCDPAALDDLLTLVRGIAAKDRKHVDRANKIARGVMGR